MTQAISFDDLCFSLAEQTGKSENLIRAEIEGLAAQRQIPLLGAAAVWMDLNSADLARKEYPVKIVRKSPVREFTRDDGTDGAAMDIELLYVDLEGNTKYNRTTVWDDRAKEVDELVEPGAAYLWKAIINARGQFRSIEFLEQPEDMIIPAMEDVTGMSVYEVSKARAALRERDRGVSTVVTGWIGSVINPQGGDVPIGFRMISHETAERLTVWFSGQYSNLTPERQADVRLWLREGLEVGVFGFFPKDGELRTNAQDIWRMGD